MRKGYKATIKICYSGALIIKLFRKISNLKENLKCIFTIIFQLYLNETAHGYEKLYTSMEQCMLMKKHEKFN